MANDTKYYSVAGGFIYTGVMQPGDRVATDTDIEAYKAVFVARYIKAVDELLLKTANSHGYDSAYTCLSYLQSTDPKWKAEAEAFNVWRDAVWNKCHEVLNAVEAGTRTAPSVDELLEELPKIEW